jgi:hypothetical protein
MKLTIISILLLISLIAIFWEPLNYWYFTFKLRFEKWKMMRKVKKLNRK